VELPSNYALLLATLRERIRSVQVRAALAVNRELVLLYWQIGREILAQQAAHGWGARVIERLSEDLRLAFPELKGFSPRNLKYMRAFAEAWPDEQFVQEVLAQITWYHNIAVIEKLDRPVEREWYARKAIANGWSRNILVHQIESRLHQRIGEAQTNFAHTLPPAQSELAQQVLKDPYIFDFLGLGEEAQERDLERALIEHLRAFLLELGLGFAFIGSQYHLEVGGQDFYLDLLFYHFRLRCFVTIDLKVGEFQPEYAGKMSFYLSALDELLRGMDDQPSIGVILCRAKNRVIVEYALRDLSKPIGVSAYQLTQALPESLKGSLPSIEDLEAELLRA
jgi:predicted nuclease of restriction endonuclease-like (RecB) superfamily